MVDEAWAVGDIDGLVNESESPDGHAALSFGVRVLYALNGATLALPATALIYIVNTRVAIPVEYLSAYGAIAFLPFSLKPIFAFVSEFAPRREVLLALLLALSGVSIAATSLIPSGGIFWCFFLALLRGLTSAWPEFLLGVSLLDEAQQESTSFENTAARFQSEAATSRNIGSLVAYIVVLVLLVDQQLDGAQSQLNDTVANMIMLGTGALNLMGAVFAWAYRVGAEETYTRLESEDIALPPGDDLTQLKVGNHYNALLVVFLQLSILVFALKQPFTDATSSLAWGLALMLLLLGLLICVGASHQQWTAPHRVGIFLVLKHAMPTPSYLMSSFVYGIFQTTPVLFQLLSLFDMSATTLASWSYGNFLTHFTANRLWRVVVGTTIAYAVASLLNLVVVGVSHEGFHSSLLFFFVGGLCFVTTFFSELYFLPSTVLATTSVVCQSPSSNTTLAGSKGSSSQSRMRYGALVSCIDFGGQIGSWLTVPLVAALRIRRENGFTNIDNFVTVAALMSTIPLLVIPLVRKS